MLHWTGKRKEGVGGMGGGAERMNEGLKRDARGMRIVIGPKIQYTLNSGFSFAVVGEHVVREKKLYI